MVSVIIELLFKAMKCCGYCVMTKLVGHVASRVPCKIILDLNVLINRIFEAKIITTAFFDLSTIQTACVYDVCFESYST